MKSRLTIAVCVSLLASQNLAGWGVRGHTVANLAAAEGIGDDGPAFLHAQKAYIGHLGTIPDTWRSPSEPYLRISEDANHGWYTEGFDFIPDPPHSRTEFTLRVYDEYLKTKSKDPERAKLLNIRYTGLQAYSMIEGYERMKAGMRLYRLVSNTGEGGRAALGPIYAAISPLLRDPAQVKQMLATDIAFYMGWLGRYVADAAQPLHNSIHHDGWSGANPKGYTRDTNIHGRFETQSVDLNAVTEEDVLKYMRKEPRVLDNVWKAVLDHSLEARGYTEDVYRLDLRGAFGKKDADAQELVCKRLASGAGFLRDLAYTAWVESAKPVSRPEPKDQPQNPDNPRYNPAPGSAPAK
jgi:hypothetical protein